MAILSRKQFGEQARAALKDAFDEEDGLNEYAVWADYDLANDRYVVRKIEPYDPTKIYPRGMAGVVRAKDELDVYRFLQGHNR